jgi:anti-anti-sigma factor
MPTLDLPSLSSASFALTWDRSEQSVVVRLVGNADADVAPALAHFLERLHQESVAAGIEEVLLDFRELHFLTSSCIKYLVVAIKRLETTEPGSQYRLRLVPAPALRWQLQSFEVLCQMAPSLVRIDRTS